MKFKIVYNPEFYGDILQAVDWYNEKKPGLGDKFFDAVKKITKSLSTSALHYAIRYDDIRCMPMEKFPYVIHYRVDERTKIVIINNRSHFSLESQSRLMG